MTHPRHPTHLEGSKWSYVGAHEPAQRAFKHWEVATFRKASGVVVLFAILDKKTTIEFPWRELRDRDEWEPGWI